jgi:DNA-3-methyladenine glycosylase II
MDPATLERARRSLLRRDRVLAAVIRRVGSCALRRRGNPYQSLLRSVLFQQLAGAAALAIERRLLAYFDGRYPSPAELLAAADADLRALGLSRQKIASWRAIATAFGDGTVRERALYRLDDDAVIEQVTVIKGIGEWTAHMLLIFSLGRLDILPVGDYGVRKGVQLLYRLPDLPDRATLSTIAEHWRPYRSVASWYVWQHLQQKD